MALTQEVQPMADESTQMATAQEVIEETAADYMVDLVNHLMDNPEPPKTEGTTFTCDVCKGLVKPAKKRKTEVKKTEKQTMVVEPKDTKCYVTQEGNIEGKLVIPCTVHFV